MLSAASPVTSPRTRTSYCTLQHLQADGKVYGTGVADYDLQRGEPQGSQVINLAWYFPCGEQGRAVVKSLKEHQGKSWALLAKAGEATYLPGYLPT